MKTFSLLSSGAAALAMLAVPQAAEGGAANLALNPDQLCYDATRTTMTVTIDVSNLGLNEVCGGQFFLDYDQAMLDFVSADPSTDFPIQVFESVDEINGLIDYAVGVNFGDSGTSADTTMAVLTFNIISGDICTPTAGVITYRVHDPPTRLTDCLGIEIAHVSQNLSAITIDQTGPVISAIDDPFVIDASGSGCTGRANLSATANDNCDGPVPVTFFIDLNGNGFGDDPPCPSPCNVDVPEGTTPARATATDACGNTTNFDFDIQFNPVTELDVTVELSPNIDTSDAFPQTLSRAITFELFVSGCTAPTVVCEVIDFTIVAGTPNTAIGTKRFTIPCGDYTCIQARDALHTLRRTTTLTIVSGQYSADFTGSLIGGNLNDDCVIDILDFGVFAGEFGTNYEEVYQVTACASAFEDISGTGTLAPVASASDDDGDVGISLGFSFDFFGDPHTTVNIASNGYLTFGSDVSDFTNDDIPDALDPNDLIAPFWDNLSPNNGGTVHYETRVGPTRFIAQWTDVPEFTTIGANTFQAVLFEGSNCIEFRYGAFTATPGTPPAADVTIGIENQDGTDGIQIDGATIAPGSCVSFCPSVGGNTSCTTTPPHADISGNGLCGVEDFTFISNNFMAVCDTSCCTGASGGSGGASLGLGSSKGPPAVIVGRGGARSAARGPAPAPTPTLTLAISVEELY